MAFVYQSQRWKPQQVLDEPGPAHYTIKQKSHPKGGYILPEHHYIVNRLSQDQQKLLRQGLIEKQQRYHYQSSQKILKRSQSAKLLNGVRSSINQQSSSQIQGNGGNNRQSANTNGLEYYPFDQIKSSKLIYKRPRSYINYKSNSQLTTKQLFNDKNLRKKNQTLIIDQHKEQQQQQVQQEDNYEFFNSILTSQQPINANLNKFAQSRKLINFQNSFNAHQPHQPSFMKKQNHNFIIANQNFLNNNYSKQTKKLANNTTNTKNDKILDGKMDSYEDIQTTAIGDSFNDEQDSIQYIVDATPGPGEYELRKDKPIAKSRIERFGVTEPRFKQSKKHHPVLTLNANMPTFKKSSKAPQNKVSFGKSRPQTAKQTVSEFLLYEDRQTIENRCIRNLIKDRTDPGTFLSKSNRFEKIKKQHYFGPDFFYKTKQKPITLPDSTYMSRVQRHEDPISPTAMVDFNGQKYKTIEKQIVNLNQRKQLFDSQIPGFSISEPRFKYKQKQNTVQFIPKFNRDQSCNKKQLKAYTFRRQQTKQKSAQGGSPGPWAYNTQMVWVKHSHHVRFKF